jgi:hypothetical protein
MAENNNHGFYARHRRRKQDYGYSKAYHPHRNAMPRVESVIVIFRHAIAALL